MKIIASYPTDNPEQAALAFGAILAADKGIGNRIEKRGTTRIVVADDGKAVEFTQK